MYIFGIVFLIVLIVFATVFTLMVEDYQSKMIYDEIIIIDEPRPYGKHFE